MKKWIALLTFGLFFAGACALSSFSHVLAADKTLQGSLIATQDGDGNMTELFVTTVEGEKYQVTLDDNGKKLGKELNGKKVELSGNAEEKNGAKTITVSEYKEMK